MLKLVQDDFLLLKRFVGETDDDFFAYLAAISKSVAVDWFRRRMAAKRLGRQSGRFPAVRESIRAVGRSRLWGVKKGVLGRELREFADEVLREKRRCKCAPE